MTHLEYPENRDIRDAFDKERAEKQKAYREEQQKKVVLGSLSIEALEAELKARKEKVETEKAYKKRYDEAHTHTSLLLEDLRKAGYIKGFRFNSPDPMGKAEFFKVQIDF